MAKLGKEHLVSALIENMDLRSGLANSVVDVFVSSIETALLNEQQVEIREFGKFKQTVTKNRSVRNPSTGETFIGNVRRVSFSGSKKLATILD